MPHFEVHTLAQDRWLIDGIFFDKETAIDDAKLLLGRTRALDAVRVLQVEERHSGFFEWTVYVAARPRARARRRAAGVAAATPHAAAAPEPQPGVEMSHSGAPAPRPARQPRPPARARSSGAPALLLVTLLTLTGIMILFAHRPSQPKWVWVFDRPEAWQKHELRSPWAGEASR